MNITIDGQPARIVFARAKADPKSRQHRWTRATVYLPHDDHSHILASATVRAYPPDVFTREGGRFESLLKALDHSTVLTCDQKTQVMMQYLNRPRPGQQETCEQAAAASE